MNKWFVLVVCVMLSFPSISHSSTLQLPKTGQVTTYSDFDDGDLQAGLSWPSPRFIDNRNSAITDTLTGLMWVGNGNLINERDPGIDKDGTAGDGAVSWQHALDYIRKLNGEKYLGYSDWYMDHHREEYMYCLNHH